MTYPQDPHREQYRRAGLRTPEDYDIAAALVEQLGVPRNRVILGGIIAQHDGVHVLIKTLQYDHAGRVVLEPNGSGYIKLTETLHVIPEGHPWRTA